MGWQGVGDRVQLRQSVGDRVGDRVQLRWYGVSGVVGCRLGGREKVGLQGIGGVEW